MAGDLHIHTRYSDGSYNPTEALGEARRLGLDFISFVDHDTVKQTGPALAAAIATGITVIPGVEISAYDFARGRKVHILGYGYEAEADAIQTLCDPLIRRRHENTLRQIELLRKTGYPVDENEVQSIAAGTESGTGRWLYKQHIMLVLVAKGLTDTVYGSLYRELFKNKGICAWDITYVDARDAVEAVVSDGGLPVLAHPGQTDSWDIIPELAAVGLAGIELYHSDHGASEHRRVQTAAIKHDLIVTGGSDDHGDWGSVHRMGDIHVPAGVLEDMRERGAARIPFPGIN